MKDKARVEARQKQGEVRGKKGKGSRFQTQPRQWNFKGDKILQHTFLWMGSKAGSPMP
jgi:hypothetical protein